MGKASTKQTEPPLMECGHTANAHDGDKVVCAICCPDPRSWQIAESPDLSGRVARCSQCGRRTTSSMRLPFFEYQPDQSEDSYYCGCRGWD